MSILPVRVRHDGEMPATDRSHWESIADRWLEEFCEPGRDPLAHELNFPALLARLPPPSGIALDVGCGDGRLSRVLADGGHRVAAIEPVGAFAHAAVSSGVAVARADGVALPVRDASVSLAISSMVLMDVDDLDAHVAELSRVLRPGGRLAVAVLHPLGLDTTDVGDDVMAVDRPMDSRLLVDSPIADDDDPVRIWHRPIAEYVSTLGRHGLAVIEMVESRPDDEVARRHAAKTWQRIPLFLHLHAIRVGESDGFA